MLRNMTRILMLTALGLLFVAPTAMSQNQISRDNYYDDDGYQPEDYDTRGTNDGYQYGDRARVDRYLGVEVWTNHNDGDYYAGDRIVINYRANRDAFVAIYNIDSRGRVNMLFPANPGDDNYIVGGITYRLPGPADDYDLVVSGPEGVENIQIVASREPFPIPDWYPASGLVADTDNRYDFMDYLNDRYFVRYGGQRFAYDRTAIYVNEWEEYYFQPVYRPVYHPWTIVGNVYLDYPFGSAVYVNGIYWGTTPLYLPRVYVGWHTFTIYDHWGHCWESDIHISRYHTVVLDQNVIHTTPTVKSKYREVRTAGYRDPVKSGYPNYVAKKAAISSSSKVVKKTVVKTTTDGKKVTLTSTVAPKQHLKGSAKVVKTERGYETAGLVNDERGSSRTSKRSSYERSGSSSGSSSKSGRTYTPSSGSSGSSKGKAGRSSTTYDSNRGSSSQSSGSTYQRKSGSSSKAKTYKATPRSGSSSKGKSVQPKSSTKSSGSSSKGKGSSGSAGSSDKSGSSSKSTGGSSKSSSSSKGKGGR